MKNVGGGIPVPPRLPPPVKQPPLFLVGPGAVAAGTQALTAPRAFNSKRGRAPSKRGPRCPPLSVVTPAALASPPTLASGPACSGRCDYSAVPLASRATDPETALQSLRRRRDCSGKTQFGVAGHRHCGSLGIRFYCLTLRPPKQKMSALTRPDTSPSGIFL
jgi:hypothetical protein